MTPKHRLELHAIGQRQSPEFEAAFPGLPRVCQSRAAESSQTSKRKPTALLYKDYASALRYEINDTIKPRPVRITAIRATTAETMSCQPDRNEAGKEIPKLGQQEERNRIRRAKARAKKRSQKEEKRKMERKMAERRKVLENWGRKEQEWSERKNMRGLREWEEWDWYERESQISQLWRVCNKSDPWEMVQLYWEYRHEEREYLKWREQVWELKQRKVSERKRILIWMSSQLDKILVKGDLCCKYDL